MHFIANREEPAGFGLRLFGDVSATSGGKHLEASAQEVVKPDGAIRSGNLVAQVHTAAEGPAYFELSDNAVLESDQPIALSSAAIGCTSVSAQHITSTGRLFLPAKLRMISAQWHPRSIIAPPPATCASQNQALCGPGCVSCERTQSTSPNAPALTELQRFDRFWGIDQVFRVSGEHTRLFDRFEHLLRFGCGASQQFGAEHCFTGCRRHFCRKHMLIVGQTDDHRIGVGVCDRRLEVIGGSGNSPLRCECFSALAGARVHRRDPVAPPMTVERHGVEHADQSCAEQRD